MEIDYKDRYQALYKIFKDDTIRYAENEKKWKEQLRFQMVEAAQLKSELDDAKNLIEQLLSRPVDNSR